MHIRYVAHWLSVALGLLLGSSVPPAYGAVYNGQGLRAGIDAARGILSPSRPLRTIVVGILRTVLNFMALAATIAIIVAGIYLIAGNGSDESKTKAKSIIIYTIVGLIIILVARVIVHFVITTVQT
ncbi:MAG: hypothetical protein Greene041619_780 [Candidatus Peregrinibacteria bacterium Greene0416_19]|nr:MAG: hypothetical protein Greene041619_780 [Candidatus Peregrinibacteria bacterium Greene0416_19]